MKIAFLLYPVSKVRTGEDSSFWILWELTRRGHEVFYFESGELFWVDGLPHAYLREARLDAKKGYLPSPFLPKPAALASMHCIFIRKEPPFNNEYLYSLQLLDTIKDRVFILNDPAGVALCNEKLFTLNFKNYSPESLVTNSVEEALRFIKKLRKKVVVKPLHEKGGTGLFFSSPKDRNLPSLLQMATRSGFRKVMVQRFVDADRYGDKRILILNGEILGSFLRKPGRHDFRANLSVGATMHRARVSAWDEKLVAELAPRLLHHGLWFVGIDVIGKYLTEVNVTSPAGIPEINFFEKSRPEKKIVDFIERFSGRKRFSK